MKQNERFLILVVGVLIGIIVMQWAMPSGQASIVDPTIAGGNIIGVATEGFAFSILTADGSIYWVTDAGFDFRLSIPIPVSEVAFYAGDDEGIIAKNGDVWKVTFPSGQDWVNLGKAPGSTVDVAPSTWGSIKDKYKDKE